MPRYSAVIRDSNTPSLKRARYIWAPTPRDAAEQAKEWLVFVRRSQFRMRGLNAWSIAGQVNPHTAPEILLAGHIPAGE